LTPLKRELDKLLLEHSASIEQRLVELDEKPRADMFLVVPHRFEACIAGVEHQGLPLITDLIDVPEVRAYRRL
jgi:hypothetical protein